jgi:hypothetical protein
MMVTDVRAVRALLGESVFLRVLMFLLSMMRWGEE